MSRKKKPEVIIPDPPKTEEVVVEVRQPSFVATLTGVACPTCGTAKTGNRCAVCGYQEKDTP